MDISQVVNDFRLFSEFQLSYKKTLKNPSLFTFMEFSGNGLGHSKLRFNGTMAHNYVHVAFDSHVPLTDFKTSKSGCYQRLEELVMLLASDEEAKPS